MPLPDDLVGLANAGYRYSDSSQCKCGMKMLWFITPKNARMPFSLKAGSVEKYEPHWASCANREEFRRKRK